VTATQGQLLGSRYPHDLAHGWFSNDKQKTSSDFLYIIVLG